MTGRDLSSRAVMSLLVAGVLGTVLGGCSTGAPSRSSTEPVPSVRTLTPLPAPTTGRPAGRLTADLRQSSRDAALGRFEVWLGNGLDRTVTPTRIRYRDARFTAPVRGERLRSIPSGSERGYPLAQPDRPRCGRPESVEPARVEVRHAGGTVVLPVEDEADVVARYVATRCLQLAVERVARLSFADEVRVDRPGPGAVGTLVLLIAPTGRPGHELRLDTVSGTPVLTPDAGSVWRPEAVVRGAGPPVRIELPVRPARCDGHAFMESGGATAFKVAVRLDGEPGQLVVRMGPRGAFNALEFARLSCGLGE